MKLILEAIKSLFRKIEAQRTHYDTRGFVDTQANTVEGTTVEWGYIKVADRIDFDFTQVTAISIKATAIVDGEELTQEITDLPVSVYNDFGNALDLVSFTDEWDDYYWAVYFPDQESADIWVGEEDHPFTPGLYIRTDIEDKAVVQTVTYSFTLAVGELKRLDEKYLPEGVSAELIKTAQNTANEAYSRVVGYDATIIIKDGSTMFKQGSYDSLKAMIVAGERVRVDMYEIDGNNTYSPAVLRVLYDEEDDEIEITTMKYTGTVEKYTVRTSTPTV